MFSASRLVRGQAVLWLVILVVAWVASLFALYQWCHEGGVHLELSKLRYQQTPAAQNQQLQQQQQQQQQQHAHTHQHEHQHEHTLANTQTQAQTQTPRPTRSIATSQDVSVLVDPCAGAAAPPSDESTLAYMRRAAPSLFDAAGQVKDKYKRATPSSRWRVYWGVMYNREATQLLTLLHTHGAIVDHFVVVEAKYNHQNQPNTLNLPRLLNETTGYPNFKKWIDSGQLIWHVIEEQYPPDKFQYWEAEVNHRIRIGEMIQKHGGVGPDDTAIITDQDEILDPRLVKFIKQYHILGTGDAINAILRWTYYGYMWQHPTTHDIRCIVTKATIDSGVNANSVRGIRDNGPNVLHVGDPKSSTWGGWHCSWCFPVHLIEFKMLSYLHTETKMHFKQRGKPIQYYRETGSGLNDGMVRTSLVPFSDFVVRSDWSDAPDSERNKANLAPQYTMCHKNTLRWLFDPTNVQPQIEHPTKQHFIQAEL